MAKLSAAARRALPDSAFAGPDRTFPIPDANHARAALGRINNAPASARPKIGAMAKRRLSGVKRFALGTYDAYGNYVLTPDQPIATPSTPPPDPYANGYDASWGSQNGQFLAGITSPVYVNNQPSLGIIHSTDLSSTGPGGGPPTTDWDKASVGDPSNPRSLIPGLGTTYGQYKASTGQDYVAPTSAATAAAKAAIAAEAAAAAKAKQPAVTTPPTTTAPASSDPFALAGLSPGLNLRTSDRVVDYTSWQDPSKVFVSDGQGGQRALSPGETVQPGQAVWINYAGAPAPISTPAAPGGGPTTTSSNAGAPADTGGNANWQQSTDWYATRANLTPGINHDVMAWNDGGRSVSEITNAGGKVWAQGAKGLIPLSPTDHFVDGGRYTIQMPGQTVGTGINAPASPLTNTTAGGTYSIKDPQLRADLLWNGSAQGFAPMDNSGMGTSDLSGVQVHVDANGQPTFKDQFGNAISDQDPKAANLRKVFNQMVSGGPPSNAQSNTVVLGNVHLVYNTERNQWLPNGETNADVTSRINLVNYEKQQAEAANQARADAAATKLAQQQRDFPNTYGGMQPAQQHQILQTWLGLNPYANWLANPTGPMPQELKGPDGQLDPKWNDLAAFLHSNSPDAVPLPPQVANLIGIPDAQQFLPPPPPPAPLPPPQPMTSTADQLKQAQGTALGSWSLQHGQYVFTPRDQMQQFNPDSREVTEWNREHPGMPWPVQTPSGPASPPPPANQVDTVPQQWHWDPIGQKLVPGADPNAPITTPATDTPPATNGGGNPPPTGGGDTTTTTTTPPPPTGGTGTISYDQNTWENSPAMQLLMGKITPQQYATLSNQGSTVPGIGAQIISPNALNYKDYLEIKKNPDALALLQAMYKGANRNFDAEGVLAGSRSPVSNATDTTLVRT